MNIATIITCHNRKDKTLECLKYLYKALDVYNSGAGAQNINLVLYITDDGCTDGTAEAIRTQYKDKEIYILKGDGNLFWAGGMRLAWKEALKRHEEWSYYLLLNDDTMVDENVFPELFAAQSYCVKTYNKEGICSGVVCDLEDTTRVTYGGRVWKNFILGYSIPLMPNGTPQLCDETNANILLVAKSVVDKIGIFYEGYHHIGADYDYGLQCGKHKIPAVITANVCGRCEYDHTTPEEDKEAKRLLGMTYKERKAWLFHPLHSYVDRIKFRYRNAKIRMPFAVLALGLLLYVPRFYYFMNDVRFKMLKK